MASKNRKCLSCGTKYSYCPSCSRVDALEPSWKSEFCSETCMALWTTLTKYNMEFLTKDEAKDIVSSLDLEPIDIYANCVQRDYAKVMAEEPKKRGKRSEMKLFEEAMIFEPVAIEPESHEVVIEKENE